jgi:hypothetical protein
MGIANEETDPLPGFQNYSVGRGKLGLLNLDVALFLLPSLFSALCFYEAVF